MLQALVLGAFAIGARAATYSSAPSVSTVEPSLTAIEAVQATATPGVATSDVDGIAFKRFYQIWLENIDYSAAAGDENMQWLAKHGITLENYFSISHPSEPEYCASAGGDLFGMDSDDFHAIPANVSTVVDLLDTKGISWAEYQEDIPYPGFQGFNYSNQETYANMYVRKHNPLILFDSVTQNSTRLSLIKNFTAFDEDLSNKKLPQWAFITPNMTNDAHDTTITFGAKWLRGFMEPLLNNTYFMKDTVVLLTFDENETYSKHNRIFSILVGGAIPKSLHGTTDSTFYNHYSLLSTVSMNWGLPSLGRWDCGANVFEIVANKTGFKNADVDTTNLYFNSTYPGPLSEDKYVPEWPAPVLDAKCVGGKGVLESVKKTWAGTTPRYNYTNAYPYDDLSNTNTGAPLAKSNVLGQNSTSSSSNSSSTSAATTTTSQASVASASSDASRSGATSSAFLLGLVAVVASAIAHLS